MSKIGQLEILRPRLYKLKEKVIDDFVLITSNNNWIIFSHQTALYLHDLSDRCPKVFHISQIMPTVSKFFCFFVYDYWIFLHIFFKCINSPPPPRLHFYYLL